MINPYDLILAPMEETAEQVEGAFDCQTCLKTVNEAYYFDEQAWLVWNCPDGHKSLIEGFHLD